jgi:hypothetical protein
MPSGDIGIETREVPVFSEKNAFVKLRIIAPVNSGRFNVFIFFFLFFFAFSCDRSDTCNSLSRFPSWLIKMRSVATQSMRLSSLLNPSLLMKSPLLSRFPSPRAIWASQ